MAKFLSHDGTDKSGIRAEVMVQSGTGKIKELVPRGKATKDGTYRNVEVVFTPDNPKLIRKVYALLDTTAKDLWEYVQEAHSTQKDISYRIESQRKRTIDRSIKFDDLTHSEEVVRILAAVDTVFSHEAKTNPEEDPTNDAPSALYQELNNSANRAEAPSLSDRATSGHLISELAKARQLNLSTTIIDALVASAVAAGASLDEALSAGIGDEKATDMSSRNVLGRGFAVEEKPWTAYNSDGRINPGSYMVAHAAATERFALDHLIAVYSEGKKSLVDVTDEMISQAASLALVLLELSDKVQASVVGRVDRQKNSYNRAMALVLDAVDKRYLAPVGGNSEAQETWSASVVGESTERLRGVLLIAEGKLPTSDTVNTEVDTIIGNPDTQKPSPNGVSTLKATLGAVEKVSPKTSFVLVGENLIPGSEGFVEPDQATIGRLRDLCVNAGLEKETTAISSWMEAAVGARISRRVHKPILDDFISHYAASSKEELAEEILSHK